MENLKDIAVATNGAHRFFMFPMRRKKLKFIFGKYHYKSVHAYLNLFCKMRTLNEHKRHTSKPFEQRQNQKKKKMTKIGAKETETSKKIQRRKKVCGKEKSLRYVRHDKKSSFVRFLCAQFRNGIQSFVVINNKGDCTSHTLYWIFSSSFVSHSLNFFSICQRYCFIFYKCRILVYVYVCLCVRERCRMSLWSAVFPFGFHRSFFCLINIMQCLPLSFSAVCSSLFSFNLSFIYQTNSTLLCLHMFLNNTLTKLQSSSYASYYFRIFISNFVIIPIWFRFVSIFISFGLMLLL